MSMDMSNATQETELGFQQLFEFKGKQMTQARKSIGSDDQECAGVSGTVLREDGYAISSMQHPREKLLESSLRFLQLLCENHNLEMQVSSKVRTKRQIKFVYSKVIELLTNCTKCRK